jgi:hypothetical protein
MNSRKLRFTECWGTGVSMVFGTAGMLISSALFAADHCTPATCTPTSPDCKQCEKVFEDAAAKLKNLDPGCCTPAANACAAPAAPCVPAAPACEGVCNSDAVFGCGGGEGLGEPWTVIDLFTDECGNNHLKDNGWQLGGFTQFGYQNNPDGAFTGNGPFNNDRLGADAANNAYEWDRLNLNQQYFFLGKAADGSEGLGFGFRVDMIYGVDGNEAQSFGNTPGTFDFLNGWDHGTYEWAMPQLYGEVAYNNLSVKLGHFYTPIGYEVIPSNGNFFLSRQLTFYNSEPFTHTGALATYKASDKVQVLGGWTLGMDTGFDQFAGGTSFLGGTIIQMTDKTAFTYMMTAGDLGWRGNGAINSAILTHQWTDKLQTVHQFDVLGTDLEVAQTGPFGFIQWDRPVDFARDGIARDSIGLINYAFYQVSDRVKAGVRQEWYKADSVSYYTFTYGVNVKPTANLVVRPEVRHMWSPGSNNGLGIIIPTGQGDLFNQTVFGIDAILTY